MRVECVENPEKILECSMDDVRKVKRRSESETSTMLEIEEKILERKIAHAGSLKRRSFERSINDSRKLKISCINDAWKFEWENLRA